MFFERSPQSLCTRKDKKTEKDMCVPVDACVCACVSVLSTVNDDDDEERRGLSLKGNTTLNKIGSTRFAMQLLFQFWTLLSRGPHFPQKQHFSAPFDSVLYYRFRLLFSLCLRHGLYTLLSPPVKCRPP